ncbi:MAG: preprotein translocase subunit YajC [Actinomycetota bacterium]|nr:preprotein translocase subunit YajC [Actinomycetota bacterium]
MDAGSLLMLVTVMVIFYFILVRPQKRRMKEHQDLVSSLAAGDEVVTIGGIFGFVKEVGDETVWLEIDEGVEVRVSKQAISRRITEPEEEAESVVDEPAEDAGEASTGSAEPLDNPKT